MEGEVLQQTETDCVFRVTDCALKAVYQEAGYPELAVVGSDVNQLCLERYAKALGGDFTRKCSLCRGDATCDWHFRRQKWQATN